MKGSLYYMQVTGAILCTVALVLIAYYKWGMDKMNDGFEEKKPVLFKSSFARKGLIIVIGLFIVAGMGFLYIPVYYYK